MRQDSWLVTKCSERPAGKPGECFYCKQPIGSEHAVGCVCRKKSIVVRSTVTYLMLIAEDNEFVHCEDYDVLRCGSNILFYLGKFEDARGEDKCLCGFEETAVLREATEADHEAMGVSLQKLADTYDDDNDSEGKDEQ